MDKIQYMRAVRKKEKSKMKYLGGLSPQKVFHAISTKQLRHWQRERQKPLLGTLHSPSMVWKQSSIARTKCPVPCFQQSTCNKTLDSLQRVWKPKGDSEVESTGGGFAML